MPLVGVDLHNHRSRITLVSGPFTAACIHERTHHEQLDVPLLDLVAELRALVVNVHAAHFPRRTRDQKTMSASIRYILSASRRVYAPFLNTSSGNFHFQPLNCQLWPDTITPTTLRLQKSSTIKEISS